jgi:hypothetical protein
MADITISISSERPFLAVKLNQARFTKFMQSPPLAVA